MIKSKFRFYKDKTLQDFDFDINYANALLARLKRYIRKKDLKLYLRVKNLSKDDIDFIEQISLIHLKNINLDSKINQNFYGVLDNFIFNTFFSKHFFSSFEMFRILLYRLKVSKKLMLLDVKYHLKSFLASNIRKIKIDKKTQNSLYILESLPNLPKDITHFIESTKKILSIDKLNSIIINPLNLVLNPKLINKQSFIESFSENLAEILNNANSKMIVLSSNSEFFSLILDGVVGCINNIGYPISVCISIPAYHLDSKDMLDLAIKASGRLVENKKARLIIRLIDMDIDYQKEIFLKENNHLPNSIFANHTSIISNFLNLLKTCESYSKEIEYFVTTQDILLFSIIKDSNISCKFEVNKALNYPFFKLLRKENREIINTIFYTSDFSSNLAYFLKQSLFNLNHNLFSLINIELNKKEWEKKCNTLASILNNLDKDSINKSLLDSNSLVESTYNFESFHYEIQKPLTIKDSIESKSFLHKLQEMKFSLLHKHKLEDVLYLNAKDLNRLTLQGLNNMPAKFSLRAEKEKDKIKNAKVLQDSILQNRLNIITSILASLKENIESIFATLCDIYPQTPPFILQEQIYIVIDTFKYYAYGYKQLLRQTDSVMLMNIGRIFIDTKDLAIYEIASIIAANIMIGNVSLLSDSEIARVLYYIFESIIETCPFMTIRDISESKLDSINEKIIINKKDCINYTNNNLLVWEKGESIVFISSFYDFYDAYLQVSQMRFYNNTNITIYTDEYIYNKAKEAFIPLQVTQISLADLIQNISPNVSNISIFTYNKSEMNYALNNIKISMRINASYIYKLISGAPRLSLPGYMPSFGSNILLTKLLLTSPNSVIKNNSLYSDIIGCFSEILSMDEIEFLYNLNHNYSQHLDNLKKNVGGNNIYEFKRAYNMTIRVYEKDDFFHICVVLLIAFLLDIKTKVSFSAEFLESKDNLKEILESNLKEKYIDIFDIKVESESEFLSDVSIYKLIRIMQSESDFSQNDTYKILREKEIIAEYSLPILNKNLELERYLSTQYVQIEPNFLLETDINS